MPFCERHEDICQRVKLLKTFCHKLGINDIKITSDLAWSNDMHILLASLELDPVRFWPLKPWKVKCHTRGCVGPCRCKVAYPELWQINARSSTPRELPRDFAKWPITSCCNRYEKPWKVHLYSTLSARMRQVLSHKAIITPSDFSCNALRLVLLMNRLDTWILSFLVALYDKQAVKCWTYVCLLMVWFLYAFEAFVDNQFIKWNKHLCEILCR